MEEVQWTQPHALDSTEASKRAGDIPWPMGHPWKSMCPLGDSHCPRNSFKLNNQNSAALNSAATRNTPSYSLPQNTSFPSGKGHPQPGNSRCWVTLDGVTASPAQPQAAGPSPAQQPLQSQEAPALLTKTPRDCKD